MLPLLFNFPMQFVSLCFAFTYLIKHKYETSEQGLGIWRDNSYLILSEQVKEPAITVESKYTSLWREASISSVNESDKLRGVISKHSEALIWNEMSHQIIEGFKI